MSKYVFTYLVTGINIVKNVVWGIIFCELQATRGGSKCNIYNNLKTSMHLHTPAKPTYCYLMYFLPYNENSLREEIFSNHTILPSEEIFVIFEYYMHNKRYTKYMDLYLQK